VLMEIAELNEQMGNRQKAEELQKKATLIQSKALKQKP